ncbi:hypothetical protein AMJ39_00715 [candidate division TA06 bacterium DG_24]|uniref:LiaI-LiaF-like transmembrane region domain-containing protein n=3 Tax=Bacteria division TA06 TaxID=1156500 RepID=A0A0S8JNL8_UNCT6|nr:MAG: hypothetical protein AMJ39_00715 [candidate division TA06 bacterium DG_24]KPK70882.1 MAG: hypothetical protein AMJ82_01980 [candidate division TA06 bacterium SM23_40]KPL10267.1 MAG: hypothetical protein AMJ71_03735 [candidate division TA06 bacterium SM1_40]
MTMGHGSAGSGRRRSARVWLGLIVAAIGLLIWFSNIGLVQIEIARHWPLLLVLIGLALMAGGVRRRGSRPRADRRPRDPGRREEILDRLERREISAEEAVARLRRERM